MAFRSQIQGLIGTRARIAGVSLAVALALPGCHRTAAAGQTAAPDPADANFAPVNGAAPAAAVYAGSPAQPAQVLAQRGVNEAQQQAEEYAQLPAPIERRAPDGPAYPAADPNAAYAQQGYADQDYVPSPEDAAADQYAADLTAEAASEPPPPLPDYEQPPAPDPDYLWTPGYWGWGSGSGGYYWIPGVWVAAPYTGALWTPGYWGFVGGGYRFHHGFWGSHIGFYGGIDYGYGYTGYGYYGGYWNGGHFFYNTAVNRVNVNAVRNVYVRNVVVNNVVVNNRMMNRVSYNGGRGGVDVRPRPAELAVLREQRIPAMQSQLAVRREAEGNRAQFFNQNHGRPQTLTSARPVGADRSLPSALPRAATAGAMMQNGNREGNRRGGLQGGAPQRDNNPGARGFTGTAGQGAQANGRNGQFDNRGSAPAQHPESPRAVQPQGVTRPVQPNNTQRLPNSQAPTDGGRQPYNRQPYGQQPQGQGSDAHSNFRRGNAPESQPQQQRGPQPQVQQQRQVQQNQRQPQSQPQVQPRQQPQVQQHQQAQPQSRPAPQPHNEHEERGH